MLYASACNVSMTYVATSSPENGRTVAILGVIQISSRGPTRKQENPLRAHSHGSFCADKLIRNLPPCRRPPWLLLLRTCTRRLQWWRRCSRRLLLWRSRRILRGRPARISLVVALRHILPQSREAIRSAISCRLHERDEAGVARSRG